MLIVVVDSNVLLQCKPLDELPWSSFGEGPIRVVVPHACMKEIDRHKGDGNTRRARRARDASARFARLLESGRSQASLGGSGTDTWELGSGQLATHELLESTGDDLIVRESLALSSSAPEVRVLVLSGDTVVRIKARNVGLSFSDIPEGWYALPEPTDDERKVISLERRLSALERTAPQLQVRVLLGDSLATVDTIQADLRRLRPPTPDEIRTLIALAKCRYPMASKQEDAIPSEWESLARGVRIERPLPWDFEIYQNVRYPEWIQRLRQWIPSFVERRNLARSVTRLSLAIENVGTVPADGVILEYTATRGARLLPPDDDDAGQCLASPRFPQPPDPPRPRLIQESALYDVPVHPTLLDFPGYENRADRDPYAFFWQDRPTGIAERHVLECEEFRHGTQQKLNARLLLPQAPDPGNMVLSVRVTARNLPEPWEVFIPIRYSESFDDPLPELRPWFDPPRKRQAKVTLQLDVGEGGRRSDDDDDPPRTREP